jgi:hypothetical protein
MEQIRFMKHYVTDGTIKARVSYHLDNRTDFRKVVTIYAKNYGHGLGALTRSAAGFVRQQPGGDQGPRR